MKWENLRRNLLNLSLCWAIEGNLTFKETASRIGRMSCQKKKKKKGGNGVSGSIMN